MPCKAYHRRLVHSPCGAEALIAINEHGAFAEKSCELLESPDSRCPVVVSTLHAAQMLAKECGPTFGCPQAQATNTAWTCFGKRHAIKGYVVEAAPGSMYLLYAGGRGFLDEWLQITS